MPVLPTTPPRASRIEPRQRLHETVILATRWIRGLDELLPRDQATAQSAWGAPDVGAVEDKVVAEVATFAHVAARVADAGSGEEVHGLLAALALRARPERHFTLLRRAPHVAWPVGIAHAVLQVHGFLDERYDAVLRRCLASGWNSMVDRPGFREMEMRWAQAVLERRRPATADLWPGAHWGGLPAFLARRADAYALTHGIFYATDFGGYRPSRPPSPEQVGQVVDSHLADRIWEDDLDLVCELALAAACVPRLSRYADAAVALVMRAGKEGLLPAAGFRTPVQGHPALDFARCYHATLVRGLLAALWRDDGPAVPDEGRERLGERALAMLRCVGDLDNLGATWVTTLEDLPARAGDLAAMVRDGGLARACRLGRPDLAREILATVPEDHLTLTCRQARTWLVTAG